MTSQTNGVDSTTEEVVPDWLDTQFLEATLRHDTGDAHLSVISFDAHHAVPKGDNFASVLLRVNVAYTSETSGGEERKISLIVKSFPEGEMVQKWIEEAGFFVKEGRIYDETLPAMRKLLQERGVDEKPIATKGYHSVRPNTIILEDLKPVGYKMADRKECLDLAHSLVALKILAQFHGYSVALHTENPDAVETYRETMYTEENRKTQESFMVPVFKNLANEVAGWPGYERFEEVLNKTSLVAIDRLYELVKNKPGSMRVLNHGDFWTNNMMFHYDAEGNIDDVKMLDFQMVRFASPAIDLVYFLHTSPKQQVLEDHREEMLEQYHDALCDTMRRMGCDQDLFISLEQLHQEMEDKAYYAVIISAMFCIMAAEPDESPDFSDVTEEELERGEVNTFNKAFAGKRFRETFKKRLLTFENQGLI